MGSHTTENKTTQTVPRKQLRTFGCLMGGVFGLIGLWPWIWQGESFRLWAMILSGFLLGLGLIAPTVLTPAFRGWMAFAEKLGWINTRIILGLIFYVIITPMGVLRRVFAKKPGLSHKFDKEVQTYREPKTLRPASHMDKPF